MMSSYMRTVATSFLDMNKHWGEDKRQKPDFENYFLFCNLELHKQGFIRLMHT